MNQPLGSYACPCGNDTFRIVEKRVRYRSDTRIEPSVTCAKCGKNQNTDMVNTGSLRKTPAKK